MLKFENVEVVGFEHAIRGMRSILHPDQSVDLDILKRFSKDPEKHRAPLSMIFAYVDITAPLYFWYELDKYHIRSIEKLPVSEIYFRRNDYTLDDFCCEKLDVAGIDDLSREIERLNAYLKDWNSGHLTSNGGFYTSHRDWWKVASMLPPSYLQKRTVVFSYQELRDIYIQSDHVTFLDTGCWCEFQEFVDTLPHSELISWDTKELHEQLKEENRKAMEARYKQRREEIERKL